MSSRKLPLKLSATAPSSPAVALEDSFAEVLGLIEQARQRAYQAVNTELVSLYWQLGGYISAKLAAAEWGEAVVDRLAQHLARVLPGQRGFTRRNLFRMRQFFDTYQGDEKVTALLTQLPWTHTLSPALVAQYQTQLPDKQMLAATLHEFYALSALEVEAEEPKALAKKGDEK